jgi:hypothetical protein
MAMTGLKCIEVDEQLPFQILRHEIPVHQVSEGVNGLGTSITISCTNHNETQSFQLKYVDAVHLLDTAMVVT